MCLQAREGSLGLELMRMMWQFDRDDPDYWVRTQLKCCLQNNAEYEAACALANPDSAEEALARAELDLANGRFHEALEGANRVVLSSDDRLALIGMQVKRDALQGLGHCDLVLEISEDIVQRAKNLYPQDSQELIGLMISHAMVLIRAGRVQEGKSILRQFVATQARVFGRDHPTTQFYAAALAHFDTPSFPRDSSSGHA